jgi:hypothetical protein
MKTAKRPKALPPTTAAGKALVRAGKAARNTARMYGAPVYFEKNGKIIAEKP